MDFYVRSMEQQLHLLVFRHVRSELDLQGSESRLCVWPSQDAELSYFTGTSDWVAETDPPITIGWDWALTPSGTLLIDQHSIRSNLMLADECSIDLGHERTLHSILRCIQGMPWQRAAYDSLRDPHQSTL